MIDWSETRQDRSTCEVSVSSSSLAETDERDVRINFLTKFFLGLPLICLHIQYLEQLTSVRLVCLAEVWAVVDGVLSCPVRTLLAREPARWSSVPATHAHDAVLCRTCLLKSVQRGLMFVARTLLYCLYWMFGTIFERESLRRSHHVGHRMLVMRKYGENSARVTEREGTNVSNNGKRKKEGDR